MGVLKRMDYNRVINFDFRTGVGVNAPLGVIELSHWGGEKIKAQIYT